MENEKSKKATPADAELAQAAREYSQHIAVYRVLGDWKSEVAKELASLLSLFTAKDLADAFANGAAWQKQRLIDKACKWFAIHDGEELGVFGATIEEFKKYMEEQ